MLTKQDFDTLDLSKSQFPDLRFDFSANDKSSYLQDLLKQRNDLANRIDRLMNGPKMNGFPIISMLFEQLKYDFDPDELLKVAKALARIATLWDDFNKMNREAKALLFAHENPHVIALAFGSFNSDSITPGFFTSTFHPADAHLEEEQEEDLSSEDIV